MHLYLSPHLDDASLSCGGLIARQTHAGQKVAVTSFFTADHHEARGLSPYARDLHRRWGDVDQPYARRREEDRQSMAVLGAQFRHLGLLDAIYRGDTAFDVYYEGPHSLFSGDLAEWDHEIVDNVAAAILAEIAAWQPSVLYAPLCVGRHVDHIVLQTALRQVRAHLPPTLLYEDMPYATGTYPRDRPDSVARVISALRLDQASARIEDIDFDVKMRAIDCYASQIDELRVGQNFGAAILAYCNTVGSTAPAERYWPFN